MKSGRKTAPPSQSAIAPVPSPGWTFLSNHSHVLICLAQDPAMRVRDVADKVGITERAVQKIIVELETGGILTRERDGRRNHYKIHANQPLRHPVEAHKSVASLLDMVLGRRGK